MVTNPLSVLVQVAIELGKLGLQQTTDDAERAAVLKSLGLAYEASGDYKRARATLETALTLTEKRHGKDSREAANVLSDLGSVSTGRLLGRIEFAPGVYDLRTQVYELWELLT